LSYSKEEEETKFLKVSTIRNYVRLKPTAIIASNSDILKDKTE